MYPSFRLFTNQMKISIGLSKIGIFIFCLLETFIYHSNYKKTQAYRGTILAPFFACTIPVLEIMPAENDQQFMLIFHQPF